MVDPVSNQSFCSAHCAHWCYASWLLHPGYCILGSACYLSLSVCVHTSRQLHPATWLQIVEIGDKHGIRFPREFGMLLKQLLYFDRYTQLLAPSLSVLNDDRVNINQPQAIDTYGAILPQVL